MSEAPKRIGILHPGKMGVAVAASAVNSGCELWWVSENRSSETRARADAAGLRDAGTLHELCGTCTAIVSVCPPEFADATADQVIAAGFQGSYLDANAISPERARSMAARMQAAGIRFSDGGIIGLPPKQPGKTWLYLSGDAAEDFAPVFSAGPLETEVIGREPGKASALKACFAGWTKGTRALMIAILSTAQELDVLEDLKRQWARGGPSYEDAAAQIQLVAPKAWRFGPEMLEIAAALESAGLPRAFHEGAEEVYRRLAAFKNADDRGGVVVEEVLAAAARRLPTA